MDWLTVASSGVVSLLVGVALWLLLPRGVVLTRAIRLHDRAGGPLYDTWEVKNDSPVSVKILSVRVLTPSCWDDRTQSFKWVELPYEGMTEANLALDDGVEEIGRQDWQRPWSRVMVSAGDTMTAHVLNNTTMEIRYRRAGPWGVLERRRLAISGEP